MPLLTTVAEDQDLEDLELGVVDEIITVDKIFQLYDFKVLDGYALVFNREAVLADASFVGVGKPIQESATTTTQVTVLPKQIVGDVHVDKFLAKKTSHRQDQFALQIERKAKAVGRTFRNAIINGDETANPDEFDGWLNLVAAGQVVGANADAVNGGDFTLEDMDRMVDLVESDDPAVIAMNKRSIRFYKKLLRTAGGVDSAMLQLETFGGGAVLTFAGIPVLPNDYIPHDQTKGSGTDLTSMFCATFGEMVGIMGIVPDEDAGIEVENLGTLHNRNAQAIRVLWYVGQTLYATKGLSQMNGIINTGV